MMKFIRYIVVLSVFFMFCGSKDSNPISINPDPDPDPDPDPVVEKTIIGGNQEERAAAVLVTSDGGFVIAGNSYSFGGGASDFYVIKTNNELEIVWEKTFGGTEDDKFWTIIESLDGNYLCSGTTESFGAGGEDIYLIKIDTSGNELWSQTYGSTGDEQRGFVQETSGGDLIISGWTQSSNINSADMYLVKTNSSGEIIWENSYGGPGADGANSVRETSDGGFVVYGEGLWDTSGEWQGILIKTDIDGNLLWGNTYGFSGSEEGYGMQLAQDDGFVAVGFTNSGGSPRGYLLKTDSSSEQEWMKTYTSFPVLLSVEKTSDGGYILYESGMKLLKTDSAGNLEWSQDYNESFSFGIGGVKQLSDGGYVVVGTTQSSNANASDIVIIKTDAMGVIQ